MASQRRLKVLVIGGSGFVGYHVICELYKRGYEVAVIDTADVAQGHIDADLYSVDLRNVSKINEVVMEIDPDVVVHLAAVHYIPYCNTHPRETFAVNVVGTCNLLRALEQTKVRRVFLASSAGVYSFSEMPHAEDDPVWPVDIYGFTKRAMEMSALEWSDRVRIPVVMGRYFNMYGWGETTPHLIPTLVRQIRTHISNSVYLGNVHTRRDFIHVSDNARATVDLLEMNTRGENVIVNMGSGISYSAVNIVSMLSQITGRDLEVKIDGTRLRTHDRPNLVADTTMFLELGFGRSNISLLEGLTDLMETGVGPYLCE